MQPDDTDSGDTPRIGDVHHIEFTNSCNYNNDRVGYQVTLVSTVRVDIYERERLEDQPERDGLGDGGQLPGGGNGSGAGWGGIDVRDGDICDAGAISAFCTLGNQN